MIGVWLGISFVIPFPYSLIPIAAANFFILRHFFRKEAKMIA
jgi:hypothetical protein